MSIIQKIQKYDLRGRGGAEFPVAIKWQGTLKAHQQKPHKPTYVVCNASEGEPNVTKDMYILRHFTDEVIDGMQIAMDCLDAKKGYIFIKKKNYKLLKEKLIKVIGDRQIFIFSSDGGYLCGEETTLLQTIEGERREPRLKPPFPTEVGLYGCPTLVNNVETFYDVAKIQKDEYKNTRFYSISGEVKNLGVYELSATMTMGEILSTTGNDPKFKFFVQVGGGASGEIFTADELNVPLHGAGSIIVYNQKKTKPIKLMKQWIKFFHAENCGQCAPCREGLYRLDELLKKKEIDWSMVRAILHTMKDTSLCPLGKSVFYPMISLLEKI